MIVSTPKPLSEILSHLEGEQRLFVVGCSLCATVCRSGGEREVSAMRQALLASGREVPATVVIEAACNAGEVRRALSPHAETLGRCQAVLVLTCGGGVQCVQENLAAMGLAALWVHPGCNTLMQAEVSPRERAFEQHCSLCGECRLERTGGICPTTRCAKHLLNGPCGGTRDGRCEVDPERDCAWALIYERLRLTGRLALLESLEPMRDHSTGGPPRRLPFSPPTRGQTPSYCTSAEPLPSILEGYHGLRK